MDKTVMEKPESAPRNFSLVVTNSTYKTLQRISGFTGISLGAACRQMLEIMPYNLYTKLQAQAYKEQITITVLCRRILENAVK